MVSLERERQVFLLLGSALRIKEGFSPAQRCEVYEFCLPGQPCERYGEERLSPVTPVREFIFRSAFLGRESTFSLQVREIDFYPVRIAEEKEVNPCVL